MKQRGFTLLELVVVVAIIGILSATVLIPNLLRFRDRGAASRAKADLHALAGAIELAAIEGCGGDATVHIQSGQSFVCGGETYIQSVPSPPGAYLKYRFTKDLSDGDLSSGVNIDPQIPNFSFYAIGFKNDPNPAKSSPPCDTCYKFVCEKGSCWCSADIGSTGCEQ